DRVVVHVDVQVVAIRFNHVVSRVLARSRGSINGRVGGATQVWLREFALADVDAAGERSGVVVYAVVGDLQIVTPGVDEDTAATLRAVADSQAVNAGRIAPEVAGERVVGR